MSPPASATPHGPFLLACPIRTLTVTPVWRASPPTSTKSPATTPPGRLTQWAAVITRLGRNSTPPHCMYRNPSRRRDVRSIRHRQGCAHPKSTGHRAAVAGQRRGNGDCVSNRIGGFTSRAKTPNGGRVRLCPGPLVVPPPRRSDLPAPLGALLKRTTKETRKPSLVRPVTRRSLTMLHSRRQFPHQQGQRSVRPRQWAARVVRVSLPRHPMSISSTRRPRPSAADGVTCTGHRATL